MSALALLSRAGSVGGAPRPARVADLAIKSSIERRTCHSRCCKAASSPVKYGAWTPAVWKGKVLHTVKQPLTAQWTEITLSLPAPPRAPSAALYLKLGGAVGAVWLDSVSAIAK